MSKTAALCLAVVLSSGPAEAQDRTVDRDSALLVANEPAAANWIFTETVSPLDYAPVVIASAWSSDRDGPVVQLSLQCRRGRTDLVIASPAMTGRPEEHRVSWAVNDAPLAPLPTGPAPSGGGLAVKDDVLRLLTALPAQGELTVQVAIPQAASVQGRYAIAPLKAVMNRMAGPCKWPAHRQ
jgi:hypothetical protein